MDFIEKSPNKIIEKKDSLKEKYKQTKENIEDLHCFWPTSTGSDKKKFTGKFKEYKMV